MAPWHVRTKEVPTRPRARRGLLGKASVLSGIVLISSHFDQEEEVEKGFVGEGGWGRDWGGGGGFLK